MIFCLKSTVIFRHFLTMPARNVYHKSLLWFVFPTITREMFRRKIIFCLKSTVIFRSAFCYQLIALSFLFRTIYVSLLLCLHNKNDTCTKRTTRTTYLPARNVYHKSLLWIYRFSKYYNQKDQQIFLYKTIYHT